VRGKGGRAARGGERAARARGSGARAAGAPRGRRRARSRARGARRRGTHPKNPHPATQSCACMTSSVACESVISPRVSFDLFLRSTPARVTRAWLAWVRRLSSDASTEPCARTRGGWGGGRACACGESDARRGRASGETIDHGCRVVTPANFSREPIITGQRLIAARPPAASAPGHALGAARAHSRTRARTSWPTARDPTSGRRRRVRPASSLPRRTAEPTPARAAPRERPSCDDPPAGV